VTEDSSTRTNSKTLQSLVGLGVFGIGVVMAVGAYSIPSDAGYSGVGPNFLPSVVSLVLLISGLWVVWEARTGGFRQMDEPSGSTRGDWPGFAWLSVGLLANAALITTIGFILSCTLCFVCAARGMRLSQSQHKLPFDALRLLKDALIGFAISAPVYWMFTKLLAIGLPGLTTTGWL
jgi:putative tricarboxylic transport membrane protein